MAQLTIISLKDIRKVPCLTYMIVRVILRKYIIEQCISIILMFNIKRFAV